MNKRNWWLVLVGLAILAALLVQWRRGKTAAPGVPQKGSTQTATSAAAPPGPLTKEARERLLRDSVEAHLADDLNKPEGTIQADMALLASVFAAYRSIYAGRGNPIGDNREITETLLGKNPRGIILLQAGHRAINAKGELCDRWGTPFSFHAESGTKMEVRSAGPDQKMWTADDVFLVP